MIGKRTKLETQSSADKTMPRETFCSVKWHARLFRIQDTWRPTTRKLLDRGPAVGHVGFTAPKLEIVNPSPRPPEPVLPPCSNGSTNSAEKLTEIQSKP